METHRWTIATLGAIELVLLILAVSLAGCEGGGGPEVTRWVRV